MDLTRGGDRGRWTAGGWMDILWGVVAARRGVRVWVGVGRRGGVLLVLVDLFGLELIAVT